MIALYLLNPDEMRSAYGFRSLANFDPAYNNDAIIDPYSNWRGPIWINANFLDWIALRRHGFRDEAHWLAVTLAGGYASRHRKVGLDAATTALKPARGWRPPSRSLPTARDSRDSSAGTCSPSTCCSAKSGTGIA